MSNLAELNELRREAKALSIPGASRMKKADVVAAIADAKASDPNADIRQGLANEQEIEALRSEFPTADVDRQENIRVRLAQLGAVVYPPGTPEHEQYTKDLRAALAAWVEKEAEPKPSFLRVAFERIGRARGMFAVTVRADLEPAEIAYFVHRLASRHLSSSAFSVAVDVMAGKAWLEGGRFGTGTIVACTEEGEPVVSPLYPSAVPGHVTVEFPGEVPFRHLGNREALATLCGLVSEDGAWSRSTDLTPVDCLACLDAHTSR